MNLKNEALVLVAELSQLCEYDRPREKLDKLARVVLALAGQRTAVVGDYIVVVEDYSTARICDYTARILPKIEIKASLSNPHSAQR